MIELSMPAGNLGNAIYAFQGGADSVYFGLKDFSARKGAENFSFSDYRKIRKYAKDNNKKIYITINTLIQDSELERVFEVLKEIEKYGVDGIIVQDLGVIRLLKSYFPTLSIHASTQLAVHTDYGVKMLKELGAERVVLSRELSLKEIEKIRKDNPDIELKVFIHGAMCYGFSGLCMASLEKTGRSANRGECAQICRTWFKDEDKDHLFPFSMKDMDAGKDILTLEKMGIDSVKVEGRMKGNEYVYYTARYYRSILDGKDDEDMHPYTFLREHYSGFFHYKGPGHDNLITENYTGHEGKAVGRITGQRGKVLQLALSEEIKDRDGLMILQKDNSAYKFSAKTRGKGEVLLNDDITFSYGLPVYKISDSSITLKKINTDALKEEKEEVKAKVMISSNTITVTTDILEKSYQVETEKAERKNNTENIRRIFSQSTTDKVLAITEIDNKDGLSVREKDAKEARRNFLSILEEIKTEEDYYRKEEWNEESISLPERLLLTDVDTPWNENGVKIDGVTYFTLSPITYKEEEKYERILENLRHTKGPVLIGLNNIADLYWAKRHPEYSYFMDIYMYASNRESVALVRDVLGDNLKGAYLTFDFNSYEKPWPVTPTPLNGFKPPLFLSRSCYRHDSKRKSCEGCGKKHDYHIQQNGKEYLVLVRDCQTIVKEEPS